MGQQDSGASWYSYERCTDVPDLHRSAQRGGHVDLRPSLRRRRCTAPRPGPAAGRGFPWGARLPWVTARLPCISAHLLLLVTWTLNKTHRLWQGNVSEKPARSAAVCGRHPVCQSRGGAAGENGPSPPATRLASRGRGRRGDTVFTSARLWGRNSRGRTH